MGSCPESLFDRIHAPGLTLGQRNVERQDIETLYQIGIFRYLGKGGRQGRTLNRRRSNNSLEPFTELHFRKWFGEHLADPRSFRLAGREVIRCTRHDGHRDIGTDGSDSSRYFVSPHIEHHEVRKDQMIGYVSLPKAGAAVATR